MHCSEFLFRLISCGQTISHCVGIREIAFKLEAFPVRLSFLITLLGLTQSCLTYYDHHLLLSTPYIIMELPLLLLH